MPLGMNLRRAHEVFLLAGHMCHGVFVVTEAWRVLRNSQPLGRRPSIVALVVDTRTVSQFCEILGKRLILLQRSLSFHDLSLFDAEGAWNRRWATVIAPMVVNLLFVILRLLSLRRIIILEVLSVMYVAHWMTKIFRHENMILWHQGLSL